MAIVLPTALDLITESYQELGVVGIGQTLGSDLAQQGLRRLQRMVEQSSIDRLTIFTVEEHSASLVASQQTYEIGDGADFDVPRPNWIDHASIVQTSLSPALEEPISIVTVDVWSQVSLKTQTSTWPLFIYYDYAFTDPDGFGRIKTWPVYNGSPTGMQLKLYIPTALVGPLLLTTQLAYPPGAYDYLMFKLAVQLSTRNGVDAQTIGITRKNALDAEIAYKQGNVRPLYAVVDPAITPQWNRSTYKYRSDTE